MISWRRFTVLATTAAVTLIGPGRPAAAQATAPSSDTTKPTVTVAPPIIDSSSEVVHSWALSPAASQDPNGPGNRPDLTYTGDRGTDIQDAITLSNFGNVQLIFRVYATDAFNSPTGDFALLPSDKSPTDVGSWIKIPQEFVQVPPGQQVTMPISVSIPKDASPGDHVGGILASSVARAANSGGPVVDIERRTGTRVYLRVNGPLRPELAIEQLSTSYTPSVNPLGGKAKVTYKIHNRGNVRLAGASGVTVSGPFGVAEQKAASEDFPELLPGQEMTITRELDGVPALGLAYTTVRVQPAAGTDGAAPSEVTRKAMTVTPPIGLVLVVLIVLFAVFSSRAYRRHRVGDIDTNVHAQPHRM
jgi:hypothetical protein